MANVIPSALHPNWFSIPHAESGITANGNSPAFETNHFSSISVTVDISAVSGTTPSIQVALQMSDDGTIWQTIHDTQRFTATGNQRFPQAAIAARYFRFSWTILGTNPSFDFTATATLKPYLPAYNSTMHRYADLDLTTLNAVSTPFFANGNTDMTVQVLRPPGGAGVCVIALEGSNNINAVIWPAVQAGVNLPGNNSVGITVSSNGFRYYRIKTTTLIVGAQPANIFWSSTGGA